MLVPAFSCTISRFPHTFHTCTRRTGSVKKKKTTQQGRQDTGQCMFADNNRNNYKYIQSFVSVKSSGQAARSPYTTEFLVTQHHKHFYELMQVKLSRQDNSLNTETVMSFTCFVPSLFGSCIAFISLALPYLR